MLRISFKTNDQLQNFNEKLERKTKSLLLKNLQILIKLIEKI